MIEIKQDPENRTVYLKIDNITRDTRRGIRQAYFHIGKTLKSYASKKIIDGPKSGKTYVIYKAKKKVRHIASAPGEFPANESGKLRRSLNFKVRGWQELEFGAATEYARALELGSSKRNLEARPYLLPSIKDNEGKAVTIFYTEIDKALKK